jgi:Family of unknown function (DUF6496)
MPDRDTMKRVNRDAKEGKSASTQAGEFVREEIEHIREGKHGARSAKQAIAIGLSKARRAGVKLAPPNPARTSKQTVLKAKQDSAAASVPHQPAKKRSRATVAALKRESSTTVAPKALSKQAHSAASRRTKKERSASAKKASATRKRRKRGDD